MIDKLQLIINQYIKHYSDTREIKTKWNEPLVAYADAHDSMFYDLKDIVSPSHALPTDLLIEAKTVVTYFIPFDEAIVKSNIKGRTCSKAWVDAYTETNQLIADLNVYLKNELYKLGYKSNIIPPTHKLDSDHLFSNWSHRHVAFIAGLGKFGLNNMLITESGCCGRIGSFVTDLKIEPTIRKTEENCLYKLMNICNKCSDRCPNNALTVDYFDRQKCYEMCMYNDKFLTDDGKSDICGKCLVNLPCSMINPLKK
jgi:epoxyqueuosine reductase QueG